MITFLYPIFNRGKLFARTLATFLKQEGREHIDYEILVIDDGSTMEHPLPIVKDYHARGLPLRYYRIDANKYERIPIFRTPTGAKNPALAVNVGLRLARGDKLVYSSPEVMHTKATNLMYFDSYPLEKKQVLICDVWDDTWKRYIGGGPDKRALCFMSLHYTNDLLSIRGVEEDFMQAWAWEDLDFRDRMEHDGQEILFSGKEILGFHQPHPRPDEEASFEIGTPKAFSRANIGSTGAQMTHAARADQLSDAWNANHDLYQELATPDRKEANVGRIWGSLDLVVEQWPKA